jgi:hypothetical protein
MKHNLKSNIDNVDIGDNGAEPLPLDAPPDIPSDPVSDSLQPEGSSDPATLEKVKATVAFLIENFGFSEAEALKVASQIFDQRPEPQAQSSQRALPSGVSPIKSVFTMSVARASDGVMEDVPQEFDSLESAIDFYNSNYPDVDEDSVDIVDQSTGDQFNGLGQVTSKLSFSLHSNIIDFMSARGKVSDPWRVMCVDILNQMQVFKPVKAETEVKKDGDIENSYFYETKLKNGVPVRVEFLLDVDREQNVAFASCYVIEAFYNETITQVDIDDFEDITPAEIDQLRDAVLELEQRPPFKKPKEKDPDENEEEVSSPQSPPQGGVAPKAA